VRVSENSSRFANKRPQRRLLKVGLAVFFGLIALSGLAFWGLLHRAPIVVLPSPTPLPPLPSVSFSGQPALIVEYGSAAEATSQPSASADNTETSQTIILSNATQTTPTPTASQQSSPPQQAKPTLSPVEEALRPGQAKPPAPVVAATALPVKPVRPTQPTPAKPAKKSTSKVEFPALPPADFSVANPGLKPPTNPQPAQAGDGNYVLIGGKFATRAKAETAQKSLLSKGLAAKIIQENNQFRLQSLEAFQGPDAAIQAADQLAKHGLDVVIRKAR